MKLFLPSIFNSVKFCSSLLCFVLDIEVADIDVIRSWEFVSGNVQGGSFRPPKKYAPTKQAFCCTRNTHGYVWSSGSLDYSELFNTFPRDLKVA